MDIKAQLPGRVMEVPVGSGQAVQRGTVLVVLEVMKTQVDVRADRDGTVNHVAVKVGDPVVRGQLLVRLAP
ncbi:MAG TPA: biotin/lipoyl-containing protein [Candidatus Methylomirabilis sp.]|jgi:biotin carboxyl carrier protein